MRSNRLAGHELPNEGRIYWNGIYIVREGQTRCSCGVESPTLPSANARRRWHANHKDEVRGTKVEVNE